MKKMTTAFVLLLSLTAHSVFARECRDEETINQMINGSTLIFDETVTNPTLVVNESTKFLTGSLYFKEGFTQKAKFSTWGRQLKVEVAVTTSYQVDSNLAKNTFTLHTLPKSSVREDAELYEKPSKTILHFSLSPWTEVRLSQERAWADTRTETFISIASLKYNLGQHVSVKAICAD